MTIEYEVSSPLQCFYLPLPQCARLPAWLARSPGSSRSTPLSSPPFPLSHPHTTTGAMPERESRRWGAVRPIHRHWCGRDSRPTTKARESGWAEGAEE